ncbi:MAG: hypothetical protein HON55_04780 [Legionellales bacterium]|jgi:hypothetical protein|nr:hypothetical protein [Legionellales bacterium]
MGKGLNIDTDFTDDNDIKSISQDLLRFNLIISSLYLLVLVALLIPITQATLATTFLLVGVTDIILTLSMHEHLNVFSNDLSSRQQDEIWAIILKSLIVTTATLVIVYFQPFLALSFAQHLPALSSYIFSFSYAPYIFSALLLAVDQSFRYSIGNNNTSETPSRSLIADESELKEDQYRALGAHNSTPSMAKSR